MASAAANKQMIKRGLKRLGLTISDLLNSAFAPDRAGYLNRSGSSRATSVCLFCPSDHDSVALRVMRDLA